jgi:hypothetical protein
VIETYGLHWHAERVFWGWQNKPGSLRGSLTRSPKAVPVEFREQRGVYALYAEYDLVYVGQTGAGDDRLFKRLKYHRADHLSERWNRFSWFGTQWVTKHHKLSQDNARVNQSVVITLNLLEAITIAVSEPRLNLQRGRWGEVRQYFQVEPLEEEVSGASS